MINKETVNAISDNDLIFMLGGLAGSISKPDVRARLIDIMSKSPEGDLVYAALGQVYSQLGLMVDAANMKRDPNGAIIPASVDMQGRTELLALLDAVLPEKDTPDGGEFDLDRISQLAEAARNAIQKK